jgi:signal transduction histidine kinase/AmiR/NasT family two-component response regulator
MPILGVLATHAPRALVMAAAVCVFACGTGLAAYRRSALSEGPTRLFWLSLSVALLGSGVWATHFLAMLAYRPDLAITFDVLRTSVSLALGLLGFGAGLSVAVFRPGRRARAAGGAICALGVAAMHFTGVSAMCSSLTWTYVAPGVAAALLIGTLLSTAALLVLDDLFARRRVLLATPVLAASILSLHFTAMSAMKIQTTILSTVGADRQMLALMLGILVGGVLIVGGCVLFLERVARQALLSGMQLALREAPTALAVFDRDQRLVLWNLRYERLTAEYGFAPAAGLPFDEIVRNLGSDRLTRLSERRRPNARGPEPVAFISPQGRWLESRMGSTGDGGFVVMVADVTEHRKLTAAEAEARTRAEEASRAKSAFLANMSHEIRTPLNGVMGVAGALARTELAADQREMVGLIETSAKTLEALLSDILDVARIEAGKMEIRPEPFDLATSVEACAALFDAAAQAKGLDLELVVATEALGAYVGDAARLRQILSNLLSNAVKFTASGRVRLSVEAERGELSSQLRFIVSDSGIGFDEETKARLFSRFEQADGSITRKFGGTGLGLSISRSLAEAMGGSLEAEATPGQGARFVLSLDLARCAGPMDVWGDADASQPDVDPLLGLRVLLAEDHPTNRRVVELILGAAGVELTCVENGAEAVEAFRKGDFDLVLMDMQMPVMDGLTAIGEIRKIEAAAGATRTPIQVLTANAMPEHVSASAAAGADGHLSKPILADALLQRVVAAAAERQDYRLAARRAA